MPRPLFIVALLGLVGGCQYLLPDIELADGDAGTDTDTDADTDVDSDTDSDTDTDLKENGDECDEDEECESGHCENGVCCDDGSTCCTSDDDCEDNLACNADEFACYGECAEDSVDHDEYCAEGYHCDANTCFEDAELGPCDEGSDCVSGECVDELCCEHAGLCCGGDEDCPDMFSGCATDDTQTCVFAAIGLLDSGQDGICYDVTDSQVGCNLISEGMDYYGQDGHYTGTERSYQDNADGTITDLVTGLTWTQGPTTPVTWDEANSYCSGLTLAAADWRLPKRYELQMLLDHGTTTTVGIDPVFTVGSDAEEFWTGTELAGSESTTAWVVDLAAGTVIRLGKTNPTPQALCVQE
jgi:hypothetical protein